MRRQRHHSNGMQSISTSSLTKRELCAWIIAFIQFAFVIQFRKHNSNNIKGERMVWSNKDEVNLQGSCWCSAKDNYCMCTPSLAVDMILLSGANDEYIWLVQRKDTGQYATVGGFVEVGESAEDAAKREILEETGLTITDKLSLFGIYSDPSRDKRRHTASVVYALTFDEDQQQPKAADDAKDIQRYHYTQIESLDLFADHKTILMDYFSSSKNKQYFLTSPQNNIHRTFCRFP
jgi:8-oxo-dGTP diphosphatase